MNRKRTPAWWWVRFELAAGIGLTMLVGWRGLDRAMMACFGGCHGRLALGPLDMTFDLAVLVTALAVAVAGLAWMVRIIRGPRDELPPWRYRDP